jgi:hypothetical protein
MLGKSAIGVPSVQVAVLVALLMLVAACDFGTSPNPTPLPTYTLYPTYTAYPTPTPDLQATIEAVVQQRLGEIQAAATLVPTPTPTTIPTPTITPTPEPTATPTSTPSPVPTATTIPTPTPIPTPRPTPTPTPWPTTTPTPQPTSTQTPLFAPFLHPEGLWAIALPSSWDGKWVNNTDNVEIRGFNGAARSHSVSVWRYPGYGFSYNPRGWADDHLQTVSTNPFNTYFQLVSYEFTGVGGIPAYELVYFNTQRQAFDPLVTIALVLISGSDAYVIQANVAREHWNHEEALMRTIVYSFISP